MWLASKVVDFSAADVHVVKLLHFVTQELSVCHMTVSPRLMSSRLTFRILDCRPLFTNHIVAPGPGQTLLTCMLATSPQGSTRG